MSKHQEIPATVAVRRWDPGAPARPSVKAYAALFSVDPKLVPADAAALARRSHRYAELLPEGHKYVDAAMDRWRQSLLAAVETVGVEPDLTSLADALAMQAATKETRRHYDAAWDAAISPLAAILAREADLIVEPSRMNTQPSSPRSPSWSRCWHRSTPPSNY
jgi:hypothetical protein